jgi:hypothetical protein
MFENIKKTIEKDKKYDDISQINKMSSSSNVPKIMFRRASDQWQRHGVDPGRRT